MAQFVLFGQSFSIPDSYIRDYEMNEISYNVRKKAKAEFESWYKKRSGIEEVLKNYIDTAVGIVDKYACTPLFNSLSDFDIYDVSNEKYISLCVDCSSIDNAFEMILDELDKIVDDQNEMRQYRAARKAYRGRMVGGGFGLSGAIKGAVQAGAINATTGLAHSTVNAIGNMGSAIAASAKKVSLYNNSKTRDILNTGIILAISRTYENHKQLVNKYVRNYFENGFDKDKAEALFDNAMKIPNKREVLLWESVVNYPAENTLSYIFTHYKDERKNVYAIGQAFGLDFGKYVEEAFAALYTNEVKFSEQKVEKIKKEIIMTMEEFGIKSSNTLNQINHDELVRISKRYLEATEDSIIQQVLESFNKYDAPISQKKQVVHEKGIWQLASKYSVTYAVDEIEGILKRYYTAKAQQNEEEALKAKKKIKEIMNVLNVQSSITYDQLEKDCIARICGNIENTSEEMCNLIRDKVAHYDALEKNKKEYYDKIQKRIEDIWTKEDGEIFDNVYLNTDIYNQDEINSAIEFIKQKGRTSNAERYIAALQACNEKNIRNARKFQKKSTKTSNTIGIVLLLAGLICLFVATPLVILAIPGIILMVRYNKLKKNWNVLTIDGQQIHSLIINANSTYTESKPNEGALSTDRTQMSEKDNFDEAKDSAVANDADVTQVTASDLPDVEKMYCVFCGKQIEKTVAFCNFCGKKVCEEGENNDM